MFFNRQFFQQNFPGANGGPFRATYRGYSAAFLPDHDRERLNLNNGGKILLPQAALEQLTEQNEFLPNDDKTCYLPNWMMRHLLLQEGDDISVELPTATFVRFQPQSKDFLDISNPSGVLAVALRNFSCLTKGDLIAINCLNCRYELLVLELKPADAVAIIECDMEVDLAPPISSIEPESTPTSSENIARTPETTFELNSSEHSDYKNN
ncbi:unnamed protein product [Adineta steineri]|uniref:Ubiquitin fusion degradation protein UFD1 N-terminal subdomain 2 domain-containing protein n=1 Tax=Adineta steineri TaxID=433720 RepID=A0A819HAI0_9BILA|nr:unnamed protein product [Adineta steineri]CAF1063424.1 unnamed protein product [Adineta steineri]CAF3893990.1 unnamed protein product [Adineta steineri]CAF3961006.1 unnamed protein product [Adineta steineri]